jgi:hypothetical protein
VAGKSAVSRTPEFDSLRQQITDLSNKNKNLAAIFGIFVVARFFA